MDITNLYKAIQESCNIYFYTIGTGENRVGGADPNAKIGPKEVMEYAELFGLDDYTGLIEDLGMKVKVRYLVKKLKLSLQNQC